ATRELHRVHVRVRHPHSHGADDLTQVVRSEPLSGHRHYIRSSHGTPDRARRSCRTSGLSTTSAQEEADTTVGEELAEMNVGHHWRAGETRPRHLKRKDGFGIIEGRPERSVRSGCN